MKVSTYNYIWDQIIKIKDSIVSEIKELGNSSGRNYIDEYSFRDTFGDKSKDVIKNEYIRIRDDLKLQCYTSPYDENGNLNRIDHHKIAACFCKALIRKKYFSFEVNDEIPSQILLSNYKLAYMSSLCIIFIYILDSYHLKNKEDMISDLLKSNTLSVPNTSTSHDSYNIGRIKTLATNDHFNIDMDVLTYADMMFWVEFYNKQIIEDQIKLPSEDLLDVDS